MSLVTNNLPNTHIVDMHFFNETTGIVITYDGLYKTTDGGNTWALKYTEPISDQLFDKLLFTSNQVGYIVGGSDWCSGAGCNPTGGTVIKTTDGGETWTTVYSKTGNIHFNNIAVNGNGDLFLIQSESNGPDAISGILKSTDGGLNWTLMNYINYNLQVIFFKGNYGFLGGARKSFDSIQMGGGVLLRSNDGGNTWSDSTRIGNELISDIAFAGNSGYCVTDYNLVYKTIDDGSSWSQAYHYSIDYLSPSTMAPLTDTSCLLFGTSYYQYEDYVTGYGAIAQTNDGGGTWSLIRLSDFYNINHCSFYSSKEGYAVANNYSLENSNSLIKITVK